MTANEILDRLVRLPEGAILTDENRFDMGYMRTLLNTYRGRVIRELYVGSRYMAANKRINNVCYQSFYPEYSNFLQDDDCYNKFIVPPVITIEQHSDGFRYVGTPDNSVAFKRIKDRADLSVLNNLSKFAPKDSTYISYLYDGYYMEIYGQDVREYKIEAIFQNPFDIPTYNPDVDHYPLADDDIPFMEQLIFRENTAIEVSRPPDTLSDSAETVQVTPRK